MPPTSEHTSHPLVVGQHHPPCHCHPRLTCSARVSWMIPGSGLQNSTEYANFDIHLKKYRYLHEFEKPRTATPSFPKRAIQHPDQLVANQRESLSRPIAIVHQDRGGPRSSIVSYLQGLSTPPTPRAAYSSPYHGSEGLKAIG